MYLLIHYLTIHFLLCLHLMPCGFLCELLPCNECITGNLLCYRPLVESGKNPQKYIKYSAEDLDRMLGEFFEGKNMSETKR